MKSLIRQPKLILFLAWVISVGMVVVITTFKSGQSNRFFGIADDQETIVRFTSAVDIANFGFVSGQEVTAGDLIVEVRNPELDAELPVIEEKMQALRFGNRESRASMESEIVQLQADLRAKISELDSQIRNLQSRQSASQNILKRLEGNNTQLGESAVAKEVSGVRVRKQALSAATAARITDIRSRLAASDRPVDAQIAELINRRQEIQRQQQELKVYAKVSGRIGSILFRIGDTIPPYQPVLTIHNSRPTFVKGYIHENVLNNVSLEQTVWVRSSSTFDGENWFTGTVKGLGSRIVEFPGRLKVNPLVQAWGREVVIDLADEHDLLLGEKVTVHLNPPSARFNEFKLMLARVLP